MNRAYRLRSILFRRNFKQDIKSFSKFTPLILPFYFYPIFLSQKENISESVITEIKEPQIANKDLIKGEYNNRIRIFSPLEKKYLIFGNIQNEKDQMSLFQFFNSLIPFQYIATLPFEEVLKNLNLKKDFNRIFDKIDVDGDRKISYEEYLILNCIMSSNAYYKI